MDRLEDKTLRQVRLLHPIAHTSFLSPSFFDMRPCLVLNLLVVLIRLGLFKGEVDMIRSKEDKIVH